MVDLTVDLPGRAYPICIGAGAVERLPEALAALNTKATVAICTDSNVGPLYADRVESIVRAAGLGSVTCTMPAGEANKRLAQVEGFCGDFLAARLDRGSVVIALGGGVLGDVAAFSAASFMRGVPVIQIPTTIVAQVDSSVGGKTGVNHPLGKNTIGAFHQPAAVLIDTAFLVTLPERELRAGLAEVIKHGVIADAKLFEYMETEAARLLGKDLAALEYPIERSCEIKAAVVAADEREQ
ncbi:MAG: 3-dehydroquinate synthase, partial [Candidatus Hydrogenedentes bacterium]|nr:3-dehydroquinate synthase [Candidatus Hydrogenedentota bacterium]